MRLTLTWSAERAKDVTLSWDGGSATLPVGERPESVSVTLPPDLPRLDVVNNAGGIVLEDGYGADRAYQQVDDGRFDVAAEVFTACGNGMAMRTELGEGISFGRLLHERSGPADSPGRVVGIVSSRGERNQNEKLCPPVAGSSEMSPCRVTVSTCRRP